MSSAVSPAGSGCFAAANTGPTTSSSVVTRAVSKSPRVPFVPLPTMPLSFMTLAAYAARAAEYG